MKSMLAAWIWNSSFTRDTFQCCSWHCSLSQTAIENICQRGSSIPGGTGDRSPTKIWSGWDTNCRCLPNFCLFCTFVYMILWYNGKIAVSSKFDISGNTALRSLLSNWERCQVPDILQHSGSQHKLYSGSTLLYAEVKDPWLRHWELSYWRLLYLLLLYYCKYNMPSILYLA